MTKLTNHSQQMQHHMQKQIQVYLPLLFIRIHDLSEGELVNVMLK